MTVENARHAFKLQVDAWVTRAVESGVMSFDDLLSTLPGVYPTYAIKSLLRLGKANRIKPGLAHRIERQARTPIVTQPSPRSALLPPHPLDFEWRFSRSTGKDLLSRAASYCGANNRILLLGTPTLATVAPKSLQGHSCIYIGEDNAITRHVSATNERVAEPLDVRFCGPGALLPNEATVVVLDPPWYFDFLRPMLRAAAYVCRSGGSILVSLPPIGTNSHVADDRVQLFKLFAKLSLNLLSIMPDAISYDMPYFEANALAAAGYPNVPKTWRRGDLFVLEKARNAVDFDLGFSARRRGWHEVVIGRMRLFITKKTPRYDTRMDELRSIVPCDVLATVRRTDPRPKARRRLDLRQPDFRDGPSRPCAHRGYSRCDRWRDRRAESSDRDREGRRCSNSVMLWANSRSRNIQKSEGAGSRRLRVELSHSNRDRSACQLRRPSCVLERVHNANARSDSASRATSCRFRRTIPQPCP